MDIDFGDGIIGHSPVWSFSGIAEKFELHAEHSIPGYVLGHEIIVEFLSRRMGHQFRVYDLGCSTGTLLRSLLERTRDYVGNSELIGIDCEKSMISLAKSRCGPKDDSLHYVVDDVLGFKFLPANAVVSYFTLQFIPPESKSTLLKAIRQSLKRDGVFIVFEKTLPERIDVSDVLKMCYDNFKRGQGFTEEQIKAKEQGIKDIMYTVSSDTFEEMLLSAGFSEIHLVARNLFFSGWIAFNSNQ